DVGVDDLGHFASPITVKLTSDFRLQFPVTAWRGSCRSILCGDLFADNFTYDGPRENLSDFLPGRRVRLLAAGGRQS
ncbi:MAG TPA: hypothetical protein PLB40_05275, partial [Accumulibacter sp.]|nr:hypothetical protein [Accumulibacter sp.]